MCPLCRAPIRVAPNRETQSQEEESYTFDEIRAILSSLDEEGSEGDDADDVMLQDLVDALEGDLDLSEEELLGMLGD